MTWLDQKGRRPAVMLAAGLLFSCLLPTRGVIPPALGQQPAPLRLCADPDNLPFSSSNEATPGYYIELGRAVAQALGRAFQPVWVPTYYTKRQVRLKMLAGQCDGFAGVPEDADFMGKRLIFSEPVARVGYALVAPAAMKISSVADLRGHKVAVQWSSPPQDMLASESDVQTVTVLSPEEGMQDLATGKADAAFIWAPSAAWTNMTTLHGAYRVVPVEGNHLQFTAGIGFPHDDTALRDDVDRALSGLGSTKAALAAKYGFQVTDAAPAASQTPAEPSVVTAALPAAEDVAAGRKLFNENCAHCHGPDAVQGEQRRNLRLLRQRYGEDMPKTFYNTVTHGRPSKGMPNWSGLISMDEFHKILAFLSSVQDQGS